MDTPQSSMLQRLLAVAQASQPGDPTSQYDPTKMVPPQAPKPPAAPPMPDVVPPQANDVVPPQALPAAAEPATPDTPKLAPQGPKNGILRMLAQVAGQVGDQPKPGEEYNGPTKTSDKIAGAMKLAGRIGNGLAAAAGTPEQQQLAEKRSEFGPELQATTALKRAQIEGLNQYHMGQVDVGHEKNDVSAANAQAKNEVTQQRNAIKAREKGYVIDPSSPGGFRPMTEDEILSDPILSQNQGLAKAAMMSKQAEAQLAKAHADAIMNPDNPVFAQKERQIQAQLEMAKAHLAVSRESLALRRENTDMRGTVNEWQYGQNPITGERLSPDNAPSPAMYTDEVGNVVPVREQAGYQPTGSMKTQEQMAKTIQPMVPKITSQVQALADRVGPGAGRWNDFWVNKAGANDPQFAGLNTDLSLFATALGKAHFGSKIPASFVSDMMKQFSAAQSPEDLVNRVEHADVWINGYAAAHPHTVGNSRPQAAGNAGGGTGSGMPQIGEIRKGHKFIGGDPSSPSSWQAVKQ